MHPEQSSCGWCCAPEPEVTCDKCGLLAFCNEGHLANHYDERTGVCLPFRIRISEDKGRYAEATRDIKPTELIVRDKPLVVGPSRQQQVVCVECLVPVDGSIRCPDCGFPLCKPDCADTTLWHKSLECPVLKNAGFRAAASRVQKTTSSKTEVPTLLVELASVTPFR